MLAFQGRSSYRLGLMGSVVAGEIDRTQVRLAELVAALSLGIDLGFGQPMEHVLRQCLIALRLAEGIGLDEEQRAAVYYTALLINVGCQLDLAERVQVKTAWAPLGYPNSVDVCPSTPVNAGSMSVTMRSGFPGQIDANETG